MYRIVSHFIGIDVCSSAVVCKFQPAITVEISSEEIAFVRFLFSRECIGMQKFEIVSNRVDPADIRAVIDNAIHYFTYVTGLH